MKIRLNTQKQIEIQLKKGHKYKLLYHRIKDGKYEEYIETNDGQYILTDKELKQIKEFIEEQED